MKADKLSFGSPSLTNRMIMKSEKSEEEDAAVFREKHIDKISSSTSQAVNLPGYYLNGRLGIFGNIITLKTTMLASLPLHSRVLE